MSAIPWIVTTACVGADAAVLYLVLGVISSIDPAELERAAQRCFTALTVVLATAAAGVVLSGATRASFITGGAFAVFFGAYPAGAGRWLLKRAARLRGQR